MTKVRKLKRRKKFRTNMNRKRLRNKLRKLPNIECEPIKEAWEEKRSTGKNLETMGLAYDPNKVLKIPNVKQEWLKMITKDGGEEVESDAENIEDNSPQKLYVAKKLEEQAKWPRAKMFRLPNNEVQFATYMMDTYGDDYKAMVRDRKNYNQMTWRQIKAKIERFKNVPEQYAEYLVKKGVIVLEDPAPLKKIKPVILEEPVEKKPNAKPSRRKRKNAKLLDTIWQEESIVEDDSVNDSTKMCVEDNEKGESKDQTNGEPKLQLFSDDDEDDKDENDDDKDDDLNSEVSDSEDESDAKEEIKVNKNKNKIPIPKFSRRKTTNQKTKKLRVR